MGASSSSPLPWDGNHNQEAEASPFHPAATADCHHQSHNSSGSPTDHRLIQESQRSSRGYSAFAGDGSHASGSASYYPSSGGASVVGGSSQQGSSVCAWQQGEQAAGGVYGIPVLEFERERQFRTSLCGCLSDPPSCLLGCFCPCIVFGLNAESIDDGMTSCVAAALVWYLLQQVSLCGCLYSSWYRIKLRSRLNLPERPLSDCVVHICCWPCAICQEYREIQHHRISGPPLLCTKPPEEQTFAERTWHA